MCCHLTLFIGICIYSVELLLLKQYCVQEEIQNIDKNIYILNQYINLTVTWNLCRCCSIILCSWKQGTLAAFASTHSILDGFFILAGQNLPSSHHKRKPNHPGTLCPTIYTNTPTHSYTHKIVNRNTQLYLSHLTHKACVNPCIQYTD